MCISIQIKVNEWNYLKNPSQESKILFVLGSYEYVERLEGKIRKCLFFMLKYSKITVCIWLSVYLAHSQICSSQILLIPKSAILSYSISWSFHFWLILAYKKPNCSNYTKKLTSSWEALSFYKYCVSHFDHQFTWKHKILSLSNSIIRSILNRFLYQHFLNKINVQGHNRYMRPSMIEWNPLWTRILAFMHK